MFLHHHRQRRDLDANVVGTAANVPVEVQRGESGEVVHHDGVRLPAIFPRHHQDGREANFFIAVAIE